MRARGCVRTHTHRLHVGQVTRCLEHESCLFGHGFCLFEHLFYFLRTRFFFVEHEFYFFEHEFNSKFAEGMRRSRINVKKSRQNYDC